MSVENLNGSIEQVPSIEKLRKLGLLVTVAVLSPLLSSFNPANDQAEVANIQALNTGFGQISQLGQQFLKDFNEHQADLDSLLENGKAAGESFTVNVITNFVDKEREKGQNQKK